MSLVAGDLHRHVPPRQVAADGGYASQHNLTAAKARGVTDVAFHKKRGLAVEDMVKSRWVYRKLRNFRAGIEAGISCLKRAYGLARCTPAFAGAGSGAGSSISRPTSGPRWWRTTWCCSPASNRRSPRSRPAASMTVDQIIPPVHLHSRNDSFNRRRYSNAKATSPPPATDQPTAFYTVRTGTSLV